MKWKANKSLEAYKLQREKMINNALSKFKTDEGKAHFNHLNILYTHYNGLAFSNHLTQFYAKFRANLIYIQKISGLSQPEFSALAKISNQLFSRCKPDYLRGLPIHTFFKAYSVCLIYLPTLEFCDMFTLDFRTTFPFLVEQQEENRRKLGKKPLKKAKK